VKERRVTLSLKRLRSGIAVLLLFFLPTQLSYHFWPEYALVYGIRVDYLSPTLYFTDILAILYVVVSIFIHKIKIKLHWLLLTLLLILLFIAYSSLPWVTILSLWRIILILGLLRCFIEERNLEEKVALSLSIGGVFTFFLATAQVIRGATIGGFLYWFGERSFSIITPGIALARFGESIFLRPYATFPHPNALAGYTLISFFIVLFYKRKVLLHYIGLCALFATIILSWSQAAWIALGVAILCILIPALRSKRVLVGMFFIYLLASVGLPLAATKLLTTDFPSQISERLSLAVVAGHMISDYPIVGVGIGSFVAQVPDTWVNSPLLPMPYVWNLQPVHNVVLLILSEAGILGFFLLTVLGLWVVSQIKVTKFVATLFWSLVITSFLDHYWLTLQQPKLILVLSLSILLQKRSVLKKRKLRYNAQR